MSSLGPRQQSVVIAAVTALLLVLTLALTFSDSIKSNGVSERLDRAVAREIAGLSDQFSIFTRSAVGDRPVQFDPNSAESKNDESKYSDSPAALDYSWLERLPEKVPIDPTTLKDGSITWTQEAEDIITAEIERVQFPASCSKAKWLAVPMHMGGKFSKLQLIFEGARFLAVIVYVHGIEPGLHLAAHAKTLRKEENLGWPTFYLITVPGGPSLDEEREGELFFFACSFFPDNIVLIQVSPLNRLDLSRKNSRSNRVSSCRPHVGRAPVPSVSSVRRQLQLHRRPPPQLAPRRVC